MSTKCPATAAAAAMAGETRCVRPPLPCRPSKLRLLVDAQRWPGCENVGIHRQAHAAACLAPFEARFAEDPVEPLGLGLLLHPAAARHDDAVHALADRWPRTTSAAARRSSIRPLVQEPMNTRSIGIAVIGVPGLRPMYSKRRGRRFAFVRRRQIAGSGTGR